MMAGLFRAAQQRGALRSDLSIRMLLTTWGAAVPFYASRIHEGEFTVERVDDGRFTCTGPMFQGFRMDLGPMAMLRRGNVRVVLASVTCQAADQAMFRHVGIEPRAERVLALKSLTLIHISEPTRTY